MKSRSIRPTAPEPSTRRPPLSRRKLDAMVAEATVDAYNDEEQLTGLSTLIEEHLDLPLPAPPPGGAEWIEAYRHWRRGRF